MENWCGIALTPLSATPSQNHSPVLTELSHSFSDGEFLLLKQGILTVYIILLLLLLLSRHDVSLGLLDAIVHS